MVCAQIDLAPRFLRVGRSPRSSNPVFLSSGIKFFQFRLNIVFSPENRHKRFQPKFPFSFLAPMPSAGHPIQNPRAAHPIYIQGSTTLSSFRSQLGVVVRLQPAPRVSGLPHNITEPKLSAIFTLFCPLSQPPTTGWANHRAHR